MSACRSTERDLWIITQAASFSENGNGMHRGDTPEDQRWQNYVSLSFGAKAIIYGCYYTGWCDSSSHMIDDSGSRTSTYYAVKHINEEMAPVRDVYGNYDYKGTFILNRLHPSAAGAGLGLTRFDCRFKPTVVTADPVLCGCFSEKDGKGSAFVFTNMFEPQTGKDASFTAVFPGAKSISVFRKGEVTHVDGNSISLTLENREGIPFGTLVPGIESSHLVDAIKILLEHGFDPNKIMTYDDGGQTNIMKQLMFVYNGYQAADAADLILTHGGNPSLIVEESRVIRDLNFELQFSMIGNEEFRYFSDSIAHYWMVYIGNGAKLEAGEESVDPVGDFDISNLRNHRQYYYGMIHSDRSNDGMESCFFDKDTNWEVVRY